MMLRQKRPTEIKVLGILALVVGFFSFFGGLGLVTSAVSLSDIGVDVSGWEAETLGAISFGIGLYWFVLAGFCAITVLCLFLRLSFAWILTMALSGWLSIMGFLAIKEGLYVDGTLDFVFGAIISSLAYTDQVKRYLKMIN